MGDATLRNSIKVQRAMRNLTQADLAALAGVTRRSVNAIETGRMVPSVLLALKIARSLGVSVETIFGLAGSAESAAEGMGPPGLEPGTSGL
jgi:putative transcriptional regulator